MTMIMIMITVLPIGQMKPDDNDILAMSVIIVKMIMITNLKVSPTVLMI